MRKPDESRMICPYLQHIFDTHTHGIMTSTPTDGTSMLYQALAETLFLRRDESNPVSAGHTKKKSQMFSRV